MMPDTFFGWLLFFVLSWPIVGMVGMVLAFVYKVVYKDSDGSVRVTVGDVFEIIAGGAVFGWLVPLMAVKPVLVALSEVTVFERRVDK